MMSEIRSNRFRRALETSDESEEFYEKEQATFDDGNGFRSNRRRENQSKSEIKLPPGYSIFAIPKLPDKSPMPVFVQLNISKILDWDELEESISLDMDMKIMWTDFKILQFHNNTHPGNGIAQIDTLTGEEIRVRRKSNNNPALLSSIWKPNLFMEGLLSVRQPILMAKPVTIRFIPDLGWFEYITRIQVKMDCSMNFHHYPADTQTCLLYIRGFSYTIKDLNLTWYKNGVYLNDMSIQSFDAQVDELTHFIQDNGNEEQYEVLSFKIIARRKLSYHLIQTYLASSFYIVITTLCFLLPSTMVEARLGISMTTLLTLTAMFGAVRESTPIVSYIKAIDTWMVGCIFFVFLTLLQFTVHIWIKHVKKVQMKKISRRENEAYQLEQERRKSSVIELQPIGRIISTDKLMRYEKLSDILEAYSFPLFLMIFVIYTTVYWSWLLSASSYFNWNINSTLNRITV